MKTTASLILILFAMTGIVNAQETRPAYSALRERQWTIEPGIGVHTNFGIDLLLTNLLQWNPRPGLSLASHSSYNINNPMMRDFNNIKTDYNFSINQKFGIGKTFYARKSTHSFFLMAGAKFTAYKETLENPGYEQASFAVGSWSPDYGMMYSWKKGVKNCFFSFRMYLPLYPWPLKGSDINYADANMDNIALEFGVGFRIK